MKYVYKGVSEVTIRAGKSGEKKRYKLIPGKEIEIPVDVNFGNLEKIEETEKKVKKVEPKARGKK